MPQSPSPFHGGDIEKFCVEYGFKRENCFDLSTGISPFPYPTADVPAAVFNHLPYLSEDFLKAAADYYQIKHLLPIPGSQWAIQQLPYCFEKGCIAVPAMGYREHFYQWQRAGHDVLTYDDKDFTAFLNNPLPNALRAVVVINPNNPTANVHQPNTLKLLAERLQERNALLIVDEAFADCMPEMSLAGNLESANIVLLRSFGKFFGLPGLRLGFVITHHPVKKQLSRHSGPWAINSAAQYVATQAFADKQQQSRMRSRLDEMSRAYYGLLTELMAARDIHTFSHAVLFGSFRMTRNQAKDIYERCAAEGIMLRLWPIDEHNAYLRFGLADVNNQKLINKLIKALKN